MENVKKKKSQTVLLRHQLSDSEKGSKFSSKHQPVKAESHRADAVITGLVCLPSGMHELCVLLYHPLTMRRADRGNYAENQVPGLDAAVPCNLIKNRAFKTSRKRAYTTNTHWSEC